MKNNKNNVEKLLKNAGLKKPILGDDPETIELMKSMAKLSKIKYDELIRQGFNESQAIESCKNLLRLIYFFIEFHKIIRRKNDCLQGNELYK